MGEHHSCFAKSPVRNDITMYCIFMVVRICGWLLDYCEVLGVL